MIKIKPILFPLLFILFAGSFCSLPLSGGGGSDIPNGGIVVAVTDTGISISASKESRVYLVSSEYDVYYRKGFIDSTQVKNTGEWNVTLPQPGLYNVVVLTLDNQEGAFISTIQIQSGVPVTTITAEYHTLCTMSGTIMDSTGGSAMDSAAVFMSGTPFIERSDEDGRFQFSTIPPGTYTVRAFTYLPCTPPDGACQAVAVSETIETVVKNGTDPELTFYLLD